MGGGIGKGSSLDASFWLPQSLELEWSAGPGLGSGRRRRGNRTPAALACPAKLWNQSEKARWKFFCRLTWGNLLEELEKNPGRRRSAPANYKPGQPPPSSGLLLPSASRQPYASRPQPSSLSGLPPSSLPASANMLKTLGAVCLDADAF